MKCFDLKKFVSSWQRMCILAVLVLAVLICVPPWQVERVRGRLDPPVNEYHLATLEDTYRRTFAQILGGLGLLYGLYLGWRRVRAAEEGQITERFTKAIAQLGDKEMAIRLGGIYALERIAKDSEKDHSPIMEVLTAYVRENAPLQVEDRRTADDRPPTDIQAILTVIGRRETTDDNRRNNPLDLSFTQLVEADLRGANLTGAHLDWVRLRGAYMSGIDLDGASLRGAILDESFLVGTDLGDAKNLTAEQILSASSCYGATLPHYLPDSVKDLTKRPPSA